MCLLIGFLNPDLEADIKALIAKCVIGILGSALALYSLVVIFDRIILLIKSCVAAHNKIENKVADFAMSSLSVGPNTKRPRFPSLEEDWGQTIPTTESPTHAAGKSSTFFV